MFIEKDTLHSSIRTLWINSNALHCPSQCLIHNPTEMFCKDLKQGVNRRKPMNITSGFVLRKGLKFLSDVVQGWSALSAVIAAKWSHTRYWKQRFTYFCKICESCVKIWWCFGSYLMQKYKKKCKGFITLQAALYSILYVLYICMRNKYKQYTHIYYVNRLLFWMLLIVINWLTALI